jgi:hypothetical protein
MRAAKRPGRAPIEVAHPNGACRTTWALAPEQQQLKPEDSIRPILVRSPGNSALLPGPTPEVSPRACSVHSQPKLQAPPGGSARIISPTERLPVRRSPRPTCIVRRALRTGSVRYDPNCHYLKHCLPRAISARLDGRKLCIGPFCELGHLRPFRVGVVRACGLPASVVPVSTVR